MTSREKELYLENKRQRVTITCNGVSDTFTITESDIISGSFSLDRYTTSGDKIEIGSAVAGELSFTLDNHDGRYNNTVFAGAELYVKLSIADWESDPNTIYTSDLGHFIVDSAPRKLSTIKITALDRMCKFDKIADVNSFVFPMTVGYLVDKICADCGVSCDTDLSTFPNYNYEITSHQTEKSERITYRTLLQWCAALMGTCAQINTSGNLELKWYDTNNGEVIDKSNRYSSDIYENPIKITGLAYSNGDDFTCHIGRVQDYNENYATGSSTMIISSTGYNANGEWRKISNTYGSTSRITFTNSPVYGVTDGVRIKKISANDGYFGIAQYKCNVVNGNTYTMSCWLKPNRAGVKVDLYGYFISSPSMYSKKSVTLNSGWQRVTVTGTVTADANVRICAVGMPSTTTNNVNDYVDVCCMKFEKGSEATPWNPAPVDKDYAFYYLDLSSVGIIQRDTADVALTNIIDKIGSMSYVPYSATVKPMPWVNPMDRITVKDRSNNPLDTIVTNVRFTLNQSMAIAGKGETEENDSYAKSSTLTASQIQLLAAIRNEIKSDVSNSENAVLDMNRLLANSLGLYMITETQENGSQKYYFCNAPTLTDSTIIYTLNANGLAWTTSWNNGNPAWQYGITKNGNAVLNMITLHKLSADVITTGILTSANNNAIINLDTGTITMKSGSINLGNKFTVTNDGNITAKSGTIADFTIDGEGFSYYNPTMNNGMIVNPNGIMQYQSSESIGQDDGYYETDSYIVKGVRLKDGGLDIFGEESEDTASYTNNTYNRSKTLYGRFCAEVTSFYARACAEGYFHFRRGLPWLVKSGRTNITVTRGGVSEREIQFNYQFQKNPIVNIGFAGGITTNFCYFACAAMDISTEGFTIRATMGSASGVSSYTAVVFWIATISDESYMPVHKEQRPNV